MSTLYPAALGGASIDPVLDALGGGRVVAYKVLLAHALGGVTVGLLASQIWYWANTTTHRHDGDWFAISQEEITEQTALTRHETDAARKKLRDLGIIQEQKKGVPCRVWYRVEKARLVEVLRQYLAQNDTALMPAIQFAENRQTDESGNGAASTQFVENQQSSLPKNDKLDCTKASDQSAENRQTIKEEISERSTKITTTDHADNVVAHGINANSGNQSDADLIDRVAEITGCHESAISIVAAHSAEVVLRQLDLWHTRAKNPQNPGGLFRTCCQQDWPSPAAARADARARDEARRESRVVRAPLAIITPTVPPRIPAPPKPALSDMDRARLDAIHATLSTCANERLEAEIDSRIRKEKPYLAERLARFRDGGKLAGPVLPGEVERVLYEILAERAAAPITVGGRHYYDTADARAAQIEMEFS